MQKNPDDKSLDIYLSEESALDKIEENKRYTINGVVLDKKSRVARDLTDIRIYMIDHGFDELESDTYSYIESEIERCRLDLDEDEITRAAVRVVCMQFLLGLQMDMITVVKAIIHNKVAVNPEFYEKVPQEMVRQIIIYGDDGQKKLSSGFNNNTGPGDVSLKKKRGKK